MWVELYRLLVGPTIGFKIVAPDFPATSLGWEYLSEKIIEFAKYLPYPFVGEDSIKSLL